MRFVTVRLLFDEATGRLTVKIYGKRTECANNGDALRLIRQAMDRVAKTGNIDRHPDGASDSAHRS
jgi:hypothetical protein